MPTSSVEPLASKMHVSVLASQPAENDAKGGASATGYSVKVGVYVAVARPPLTPFTENSNGLIGRILKLAITPCVTVTVACAPKVTLSDPQSVGSMSVSALLPSTAPFASYAISVP